MEQEPAILVVDDAQDICDLIEYSLKQAGYRHVDTASSGQEAVALCRECAPALIVPDLVFVGPRQGSRQADWLRPRCRRLHHQAVQSPRARVPRQGAAAARRFATNHDKARAGRSPRFIFGRMPRRKRRTARRTHKCRVSNFGAARQPSQSNPEPGTNFRTRLERGERRLRQHDHGAHSPFAPETGRRSVRAPLDRHEKGIRLQTGGSGCDAVKKKSGKAGAGCSCFPS